MSRTRRQVTEVTNHQELVNHINKKKNTDAFKPQPLTYKTKRQGEYHKKIYENQITVATGPAGTAKTYVAVHAALEMLAAGQISKIIITKPTIEVGNTIGLRPGTTEEKMAPFVRSIMDCVEKIIGESQSNTLMYSKHLIEVIPLQDMRGLTLDNAFVIADEMQNSDRGQTKALLTRLGDNAKLIINGDLMQQDIKGNAGLSDALEILDGLEGVGFVEFTVDDIVRSGIVKEIIIRYMNLERGRK